MIGEIWTWYNLRKCIKIDGLFVILPCWSGGHKHDCRVWGFDFDSHVGQSIIEFFDQEFLNNSHVHTFINIRRFLFKLAEIHSYRSIHNIDDVNTMILMPKTSSKTHSLNAERKNSNHSYKQKMLTHVLVSLTNSHPHPPLLPLHQVKHENKAIKGTHPWIHHLWIYRHRCYK